MKKISYVLAALAAIAIAAPAVAQDKPMKEGMDKPMTDKGEMGMHHHMDVHHHYHHHHHHYHHTMMKKPMTDNKM